jgi:dTDP-4-dehydrorhamnose 3,5-epimerase-like enzyme
MPIQARRIETIEPEEARIQGATVVGRSIHQDPRGFLIETLRQDDSSVQGSHFAMGYTSVTVPGQMRDRDRWHAHRLQEDRFVVPLGEMVLALYDARPGSSSRGRLEAIRMAGIPLDTPASTGGTRTVETHLVRIPIGVYHCIANLHPSMPFVLQNYPTQLYDAADEGRIPFTECPIASLEGRPFDWSLVEVRRP